MSMGWSRNSSIAALVAAGFVLVVAFQNCQSSKFGSTSKGHLKSTGNGRTYDGKTFANQDRQCPDNGVTGRIRLEAQDRAVLLRDNCADLVPAMVLNAAQFKLLTDPPRIEYDSRIFTIEVAPITQRAKAQTETIYSGNPTFTAWYTSPISDGDLLVCSTLVLRPRSVSIASMTDTAGNIYRRIVGPISGPLAPAGYTGEVWYVENAKGAGGAAVQVAATYGGAFPANEVQRLSCVAYSGIAPTNSLDQLAIGVADTNSILSLQTGLTAEDNELFLSISFGSSSVETSHPELQTLVAFESGPDRYDFISAYKATTRKAFATTTWAEAERGMGVLLTFKAKN